MDKVIRKQSTSLCLYQVRGYTLVELVIVIVLLGILSAVAVNQFADISGDANTSAAKGVAGAAASAAATRKAQCLANGAACTVSCATAGSLVDTGSYTVGDSSTAGQCAVKKGSTELATFKAP